MPEKHLTFGKWLYQQRTRSGKNLLRLGHDSGVDQGTISRIENERVQPTILSVVRICNSLDVDAAQLYEALTSKSIEEEVFPASLETVDALNVLTLEDIRNFVELCMKDKNSANRLTSQMINLATEKVVTTKNIKDAWTPVIFPMNFELMPQRKNFLYSIDFNYPPQFEPFTFEAIIRQGGVVILEDANVYIREVKVNLKGQYPAELDLLFNRIETSSLEKIRLLDILEIANGLKSSINLLSVYWAVCTFIDRLIKNNVVSAKQVEYIHLDTQAQQIMTLIKISRWFQYISWPETEWLMLFRDTIASSQTYAVS